MEKVIFSLQEGEVSQVVESSYGYHIFRLDKKLESKLIPEEQASSEIELKILDQKIKKFLSGYIARLKDRLIWKVHAENLLFPYQRNDHE
jgi:parvulin-like peptidyl-prolyl isomerase